MAPELAGKVAVVTGGGGGLGAALGRAFAQAGASVALLDIDETAAKEKAVALAANSTLPQRPSGSTSGTRRSSTRQPATSNDHWAAATSCAPTSGCSSSAPSTP